MSRTLQAKQKVNEDNICSPLSPFIENVSSGLQVVTGSIPSGLWLEGIPEEVD